MTVSSRRDSTGPVRTELRLVSGFELWIDGGLVLLPQSAERLLALLAVLDRPLQRSYVAGSLWPDATDSHSAGSLRSALWRVHQVDATVVDACGSRLQLSATVQVDLRDGMALVHRLLGDGRIVLDDVPERSVAVLDGDLLPGWYGDDWLVLPREQWRQARLHALESLAGRLVERGSHAAAVDAALRAIRAEPLRESAHRCLIEAHIAEGNAGEALRAYQRFRALLEAELGVEPSRRLTERVVGLAVRPRRTGQPQGVDATAG